MELLVQLSDYVSEGCLFRLPNACRIKVAPVSLNRWCQFNRFSALLEPGKNGQTEGEPLYKIFQLLEIPATYGIENIHRAQFAGRLLNNYISVVF
jgi:hypothetical protein